MNITQTTFGPKNFLVWRKEVEIAKLKDKEMWGMAFGKVSGYAAQHGLKIVGPGTALYFTWDEANGKTEIGIGLPVEGAGEVQDPELSLVAIPESKAAHLLHEGDYETLMASHQAVNAYVKAHQLNNFTVVEEYTVDPMQKPDPKDWQTNLYYLYR